MKRDFELIRQLLLLSEERATQRLFFSPEVDGFSKAEVDYHLELLQQANFANIQHIATGTGGTWKLGALTWTGQEFLANARNDTIWKKAMKTLKSAGGSASLEALKILMEKLVASQWQLDE